MVNTELLQKVYLFKDFTAKDQEKIKFICEKSKYGSGHTIFREGEKAGCMYLVEIGSIRIIRNAEELVMFGRGEIFGEIPFFDGGPRQGTAIATEDSHLIEIPYKKLSGLLEESPSMAVAFYSSAARLASKKLRFYVDRLSQVQEVVHKQHRQHDRPMKEGR